MKDQTEVCPLAREVMFLAEGNPQQFLASEKVEEPKGIRVGSYCA
jgi:hypothetical protein